MPKTLKDILGDDLYTQVKGKLGDTEITIVDPDDPMVPKRRLDEVITERNDYKEQLKERDEQLGDLKAKAKDSEILTAQISELQNKNKEAAAEYEKQLTGQRFSFAVERAVANADARNVKAVTALLDTSKISLDGENLIGFEEQVEGLKKSDPYLFGVDLKGRKPEGLNNPAPTGDNPWAKESFNLTKQGEIYKNNPDLAAKLRASAGGK